MADPAAPETWLLVMPEGLYCVPGDFFIDPRQPVERAIIAHGHGDHARVDEILFDLSHDFVGDLAETVALIWPTEPSHATRGRGSKRRHLAASGELSGDCVRTEGKALTRFLPTTESSISAVRMKMGNCGLQIVRYQTDCNSSPYE
jgi:hypothetical protein